MDFYLEDSAFAIYISATDWHIPSQIPILIVTTAVLSTNHRRVVVKALAISRTL